MLKYIKNIKYLEKSNNSNMGFEITHILVIKLKKFKKKSDR